MRRIMIGLAPALLAMSGSAVAATPAWKVTEVSGEVRLTENGRSRAAVKGALLASGATITTGPAARAVIVRGQEFVVISPKSQLRVPAAEAPNRIMQMIEDFGTAVFRINKKSTPHFGVQTPYLAAVVKGTTFTVTVGAEGASVQVTEGAVEVSTLDGGAADLITPGAIAMVGASDIYQLTVEGVGSKILRSDQTPAAGPVTSSVTPAVAAPAYLGPRTAAVEIESPLTENPQSLSSVTDGLLDGSAAMELAAVEFADQTRASIVGEPIPPAETPDPVDTPPPPADEPGRPEGDGDDRPGRGEGEDDRDRPGRDRPDRPDKPGKPDKDDDLDKPDKGGDGDKPGKGDGDHDKPGKDDGDPGKDGGDDRGDDDGGGDDDGDDRGDDDEGRGDDDDDRDDDGGDDDDRGDEDEGGDDDSDDGDDGDGDDDDGDGGGDDDD